MFAPKVSVVVGCAVFGATLLVWGCGSGPGSCPSDLQESFDTGSGGRCLASCSADNGCQGAQVCMLLTTTTGFCVEASPTPPPTAG
jgi:hypothetical protein